MTPGIFFVFACRDAACRVSGGGEPQRGDITQAGGGVRSVAEHATPAKNKHFISAEGPTEHRQAVE